MAAERIRSQRGAFSSSYASVLKPIINSSPMHPLEAQSRRDAALSGLLYYMLVCIEKEKHEDIGDELDAETLSALLQDSGTSKAVAQLVGYDTFDHVLEVIGGHFSFSEQGLVEFKRTVSFLGSYANVIAMPIYEEAATRSHSTGNTTQQKKNDPLKALDPSIKQILTTNPQVLRCKFPSINLKRLHRSVGFCWPNRHFKTKIASSFAAFMADVYVVDQISSHRISTVEISIVKSLPQNDGVLCEIERSIFGPKSQEIISNISTNQRTQVMGDIFRLRSWLRYVDGQIKEVVESWGNLFGEVLSIASSIQDGGLSSSTLQSGDESKSHLPLDSTSISSPLLPAEYISKGQDKASHDTLAKFVGPSKYVLVQDSDGSSAVTAPKNAPSKRLPGKSKSAPDSHLGSNPQSRDRKQIVNLDQDLSFVTVVSSAKTHSNDYSSKMKQPSRSMDSSWHNQHTSSTKMDRGPPFNLPSSLPQKSQGSVTKAASSPNAISPRTGFSTLNPSSNVRPIRQSAKTTSVPSTSTLHPLVNVASHPLPKASHLPARKVPQYAYHPKSPKPWNETSIVPLAINENSKPRPTSLSAASNFGSIHRGGPIGSRISKELRMNSNLERVAGTLAGLDTNSRVIDVGDTHEVGGQQGSIDLTSKGRRDDTKVTLNRAVGLQGGSQLGETKVHDSDVENVHGESRMTAGFTESQGLRWKKPYGAPKFLDYDVPEYNVMRAPSTPVREAGVKRVFLINEGPFFSVAQSPNPGYYSPSRLYEVDTTQKSPLRAPPLYVRNIDIATTFEPSYDVPFRPQNKALLHTEAVSRLQSQPSQIGNPKSQLNTDQPTLDNSS